jgi:hypothetical protein
MVVVVPKGTNVNQMDVWVYSSAHSCFAFLSPPSTIDRYERIQNGIWLELYVGSYPAKYAPNKIVWHLWNKARNRRGAPIPIDLAAP